jgi:hypothetical protein
VQSPRAHRQIAVGWVPPTSTTPQQQTSSTRGGPSTTSPTSGKPSP